MEINRLGYYIGITLIILLNLWTLTDRPDKSQRRVIGIGNLFGAALIANWFVQTRNVSP